METAVAFHRSFFPKIRLKLILNWQVFWLTSLFAAFPLRRIETVAGITKSFYKGLQLRVQLRYCTGFPFLTHFRNRKLVNQIGSKVENIPEELTSYPLIMSRMMGFSPLKKNSTAITMTMSPIRRIITLMPVCPSILRMRDEL